MPRTSHQITRWVETKMSKEKLESDYQTFIKQVEQQAQEAIKSAKEKADAIKEDAKKIGESVQGSLNKSEVTVSKKKVNS